jgi:hypothetical protein
MWINCNATSILNRVFIRSRREFKIAVCAASSDVGRVGVEVGAPEFDSSHTDGVDGRAGVTDCAGVDGFPVCVDDRECVPGKGSVGSTETGRRITFLKDARKFVLSFSRMTFPRMAVSKSFASSPI